MNVWQLLSLGVFAAMACSGPAHAESPALPVQPEASLSVRKPVDAFSPIPANAIAAEAKQGLQDWAHRVRGLAQSFLGVPYRFGGNTLERGLDCSGLVHTLYARLSLPELPRSARSMAAVGVAVAPDELQPGDLVFFNTRGFMFSHVGVYIGGGRFIHASSVKRRVVENDLFQGYYQKRFNGARRIEAGKS